MAQKHPCDLSCQPEARASSRQSGAGGRGPEEEQRGAGGDDWDRSRPDGPDSPAADRQHGKHAKHSRSSKSTRGSSRGGRDAFLQQPRDGETETSLAACWMGPHHLLPPTAEAPGSWTTAAGARSPARAEHMGRPGSRGRLPAVWAASGRSVLSNRHLSRLRRTPRAQFCAVPSSQPGPGRAAPIPEGFKLLSKGLKSQQNL